MPPSPAEVRRVLLAELAWLLAQPVTARFDYDAALRRIGALLVLLARLEPAAVAMLEAPS